MIAAIYARKSTEQSGVADEAKSVSRQIEHARAFASRKGWIVDDAHVYVDDGISGAEFARRPGFLRLMNALKPKPAFDVLVISEESRLGREQLEVGYILKQVVQAGVRVFCYLTDTERTLNSPMEKAMLALQTMADEMERERARQRTYDALRQKAHAGHVTGGRVFGFDNVEILGPTGTRSHVERRINQAEAVVVRRIFELSAHGRGMSAIAKRLNDEGALAPRAQQARPRGWAPSSVREVLHRPLYRGQIVWNKSKKRDGWGQHRQTPRPEREWLTVDAPELRIVPDALWQTAHARLSQQRATYLRGTDGQLWGRPKDRESRYLLTGFARCGCCHATLCVRTGTHGRGRAAFYKCGAAHRRGRAICENTLEVPMRPFDAEVISTLERYVFDAGVLTRVAERVIAGWQAAHARVIDVEDVRGELQRVEAEIAHLSDAIAAGGELEGLVQALQARETRRRALEGQLTLAAAPTLVAPRSRASLLRGIDTTLADWRGLFDRHVAQSRQILRKLLEGPIVCTPETDRTGVTFTANVSVGPLIAGVLGVTTIVASPRAPQRLVTCWLPRAA